MITQLRKHPIRLFYLEHFHPHITWKNIFTVKLIVIGLAGLKIVLAKTIMAAILLVGALLNFAPMYGTANLEYVDVTKSPYGLCGNGIKEYGELCDGRVSCELPCLCQENFYRCGETCIPITLGCKSGQPISLTDPEPDPIIECENGQQRICETGQEGACAGGSQKCIDNKWTSCTPLNKSPENCGDGIDNDCDLSIDADDQDCQEAATLGCTDTNACNYDARADQDDGSCIQPKGCNQRCPGDPGGVYKLDACNVCNGDGSSCADCAGRPNGDAIIDKCGHCASPTDTSFNACATSDTDDTTTYSTQSTKSQTVEIAITRQQTIDFMNCIVTDNFTTCKTHLNLEDRITAIAQSVPELFCQFERLSTSPLCAESEQIINQPEMQNFETSSVKQEQPREITNEQAREAFIKCVERTEDPEYCAGIMKSTNLSN